MASKEHTTVFFEVEASVSYTHSPGYPATRMEPAAPDEVTIIGFALDFGKGLVIQHTELPHDLWWKVVNHLGEHHHEELCENAHESALAAREG